MNGVQDKIRAPRMPRKVLLLLTFFLSVLLFLCALEISLRVQQIFGPVVRLADLDRYLSEPSEIFHHRVKGQPDDYVRVLARCSSDARVPAVKILFMGDSQFDNREVAEGVRRYIASRLGEGVCVELLNGALTSYSPSLILIRGELLIRKYRPDFVVINIDETDLMDESIRYRRSTIRDDAGRILRVSYSHDAPNQAWETGERAVETHRLYIVRLFAKVYHRKVFIPRLASLLGVQEANPESIFAPQRSPDPRRTHAKEVAYFSETLAQLLDRFLALMPNSERILVTHHPHLLQLANTPPSKKYNGIVGEILSQECGKRGVPTYNALPDIPEMYGSQYASFYHSGDPFSHLVPEGNLRYGWFIGKRLFPSIQAFMGVKQDS